jgi:hypothetical protein
MEKHMKFIECLQGTDAWHAARCGLVTASRFSDAISLMTRNSAGRKVGDPTAVAERYAAEIAIERISRKPFGEPPKAWVLERGHEMEFHARMIYEARTRSYVTESGICVDESGHGYSSDGLVNADGLIEVKAPIDSAAILAMWETGDTSEYDHQMQGGMWQTARKWCDFLMYVPDLASIGKDLFIKRIWRDDAFIDQMVTELYRFQKMAERFESILRKPWNFEVQQQIQREEMPASAAPSWRDQFLTQQ